MILPKSIICEIFGFLCDLNDVTHFRKTCKRIYEIGESFETSLKILKALDFFDKLDASLNRCDKLIKFR